MTTPFIYIPEDGGRPRPLDSEVAARITGFLGGAEASGAMASPQAYAEHVTRMDSAFIEESIRRNQVRTDAAPAGAAGSMARQLEYVYREVLTEPQAPTNLLSQFQVDNTVPVGARTHTVRRYLTEGEAKVWRGTDGDVPVVDYSQDEESFPVRFIVTSYKTNMFEAQSASYANIPAERLKMMAARQVIEQRMNRLGWYGSAPHGLYGITNYPFQAIAVLATAFDGTASPTDVLAALNTIANYAEQQSSTTFRSNRMCVSTRVHNFLFQTRLGSVSDITIGDFFLKSQQGRISAIDSCWELQGTGPGSTDGILAYEDSALGVSVVIPQGITWLPLQVAGFSSIRYVYASFGGIVERNCGSNYLAWVDAG